MRRKCHTCLCRTCLNACCDRNKRKDCKGKIESCERYNGFWQESIFDIPQESQCKGIPRRSLGHYGLTNERVEELEKMIQSGRYDHLASSVAYTADKDSAEYILLSITKKLSYEGLGKLYGRGEIDRIPCSRTGFYYTKKYFFHLMDLEMRRIGK